MVGELSEGDIPDRAQGQADLMPNCTLARVPGAGGYVQHSAPEKCVLAWQEFVGDGAPAGVTLVLARSLRAKRGNLVGARVVLPQRDCHGASRLAMTDRCA